MGGKVHMVVKNGMFVYRGLEGGGRFREKVGG